MNNSVFIKISAFFFFYFAATAVFVVFFPKVMQMTGYTPTQIGIIFSITPLMRFLLPFLFLKLFKLTKKIYYTALVFSFFAVLSFYITIHNFYLFIISNILLGLCLSIILPFVETHALGYLKKERFGRARLFGSLGFMITGIILARNLDTYIVGIHYLSISAFLVLISGILAIESENRRNEISDNIEKFEFAKTLLLWISLFLNQMSFGIFYNFFTLYETQRGISLETVSYLWAFSIICEMLFFYFQTPLLKKFNLIHLIMIGVFFTMIRWLILYMFPSSLPMLYLSQSLHAIGFALHHTAAISYLYKIYKQKKLASQFYYGLSFGLGGFLGSIFAGFLYGKYIFLYAAIISMLSFIALINQPKQNF